MGINEDDRQRKMATQERMLRIKINNFHCSCEGKDECDHFEFLIVIPLFLEYYSHQL